MQKHHTEQAQYESADTITARVCIIAVLAQAIPTIREIVIRLSKSSSWNPAKKTP
jgi:hypothetical protein